MEKIDDIESKLRNESNNLLDTGKRTNLTNYKSTYKSTVKFLYPTYDNIFNSLISNHTLELFNPSSEEKEDDLNDPVLITTESKDADVNEAKYFTKYFNKVKDKKNKILVYNTKYKVKDSLKEIRNHYKISMEENGFNIAYTAFGFVDWFDINDRNNHFKMPILLIPVIIDNDSMFDSFKIKAEGNDIILNPALCQMLKDEFKLTIREYDDNDEPFDNLDAYFDYIENSIKKFGWSVDKELCCLGLFSFNKINMYNDINENIDLIKENENIRRIYGGCSYKDELDYSHLDYENIMDVHTVVDADSSQLEAINFAKDGKSFVLQGPPGTGKSQTITNIIAEMLYNNKKVLFVSEKMAALNVVYDKLKKEGLEDYCLELHSHKANKKDFINELNRVLDSDIKVVNHSAIEDLSKLKDVKFKLDRYCNELHLERPVIKMSLYGLYEKYSKYIKKEDSHFIIKNISSKNEEWLDKIDNLLNNYQVYSKVLGKDYRTYTWYGYKPDNKSYSDEQNIINEIDNILKLINAINTLDDKMYFGYNQVLSSLFYLEGFMETLNFYNEASYVNYNLLSDNKLELGLEACKKLIEYKKVIDQVESNLDNIYHKDFYKLDYKAVKNELVNNCDSFFKRLFNSKYHKLNKQVKQYTRNNKGVKYLDLLNHIVWLEKYQENVILFNEALSKVSSLFTSKLKDYNTNCYEVKNELDQLVKLKNKFADNFDTYHDLFIKINSPKELYNNYIKLLDPYEEALTSFIRRFDPSIRPLIKISPYEFESFLYAIKHDIPLYNKWLDFYKVYHELDIEEIIPFVDSILDCNDYTLDDMIPMFNKLFYKSWIEQVYKDNPYFYNYNKEMHDADLSTFQALDENSKAINKSLVKATISTNQHITVDAPKDSPIGLIKHEAKKQRKTLPIRKILEQIGDFVQEIKPCFLMSPISVSTYLNSNIKFDCVIFDEASQIFPYDAIGAIYRAEQLIVVGDSKQMPPTNFFNKMVAEANDTEESSSDFESILDCCIGQQFPEHSLKWHYRSKFEDLIAFSNVKYYDSNLLTFPSSEISKPGIGVDYIHVDGIYTSGYGPDGGTNKIEALKVVDLIYDSIKKNPHRSIGVVAFNIRQQDLIDTLLSKRRQEDRSCEEYFNNKEIDSIFIKNLETVQGDERDTIIFSVTYGRNELGKLNQNFGPLNKEKGERRLNVAITRAKYNLIVVSSMHGYDIKYNNSSKTGVRNLSQYLDYAENGEVAIKRTLSIDPNPLYDSYFEESVHKFLLDNDFQVDTQIGCSSYRIDLGLRKPNTGKYVLAIECDGASYHSSKTARDRDRLRQSVLEGMGWKFYRIWSTDWFRNNRLAKESLLNACNDALNSSNLVEEHEELPEDYYEESKERLPLILEKYQALSIKEAKDKCRSNSRTQIIKTIILEEAPINIEYLLKRICTLYDREKVSSYVRSEFNTDLRYLNAKIKIGDGFIYVIDQKLPVLRGSEKGTRVRDIEYISLEELALGLKEMIKHYGTIDRLSLYRRIVNEIGYASLQDKAIGRLDDAIYLLKDILIIKGENISLK